MKIYTVVYNADSIDRICGIEVTSKNDEHTFLVIAPSKESARRIVKRENPKAKSIMVYLTYADVTVENLIEIMRKENRPRLMVEGAA